MSNEFVLESNSNNFFVPNDSIDSTITNDCLIQDPLFDFNFMDQLPCDGFPQLDGHALEILSPPGSFDLSEDASINQNILQDNTFNSRISNSSVQIKKSKKKPINMKECLHVWEFLKDMLKDGRPEIQWIDRPKGIFKIVDPKKVAKEWGFKKTKSEEKVMTYPNMARGIRYSREVGGYFDNVGEYGYGVKLVYKFSHKARENCKWLQSIMD